MTDQSVGGANVRAVDLPHFGLFAVEGIAGIAAYAARLRLSFLPEENWVDYGLAAVRMKTSSGIEVVAVYWRR